LSDAPCIPLLRERARHFDTRLCIGLDPDPDRIPAILRDDPDPVLTFCRTIVDATRDQVLCYKPNAAFFEVDGAAGWERLQALLAYIPDQIPVILDAKRGDIGNSSRGYARMAFETLGADAVTVSPWMGRDSLAPFLEYEERGIFVLAATSNPGAEDFQLRESGGEPLSVHVARAAAGWNEHGNLGLVVGATRPGLLQTRRQVAPTLPFLGPGVGAQGGDPAAVMAAALDAEGEGVIVNASRSILYSDDEDFERGAARAAGLLREALNRARRQALAARGEEEGA
jgi:orotidine 5'-phosphate decarboxylase subfamily 2